MDNALPERFRRDLEQIWDEFMLRTNEETVKLVTDAEEEKKKSLLGKLFTAEMVLQISFLYE